MSLYFPWNLILDFITHLSLGSEIICELVYLSS